MPSVFHFLSSFASDCLVSPRLGSSMSVNTMNFPQKSSPALVTGDSSDHSSNICKNFYSYFNISADLILIEWKTTPHALPKLKGERQEWRTLQIFVKETEHLLIM